MAIQTRGGNEVDFQPNKMLPREMAGALDTKKVFYTFAPGDCRRLATHEEMTEMIDESVEGIKQGFTADLTQAITDSETATSTANASAQNADDKALLADGATTRAITAAENAEAIVLGDIATDTTVGVVKSGGDVVVEVDGTMSVNEASNANVTIVESSVDGEITTGLLGVILGLVKKKFAVMLTAIADKIDKTSIAQTVEISDATKVPSSVVTAWLASQISSLSTTLSQLNNNLASLRGTAPASIPNGNLLEYYLTLPSGITVFGATPAQFTNGGAQIQSIFTVYKAADTYGRIEQRPINTNTLWVNSCSAGTWLGWKQVY